MSQNGDRILRALGIGHWLLTKFRGLIPQEDRQHVLMPNKIPVTKLNYVSVAVASPRTLSGKQATLLASRRERHYELRITNYFNQPTGSFQIR
ncbi:MAG: hypothetical protein ACYTXC_00755 [Nostoc sp.]